MAKTLLQHIYSIKEQLSGYNITDDNVYDDEWLADKIHDVRSVLIKQDFDRGNLSDLYFQRYCCLEVLCRTVTCPVTGTLTYPSRENQYYVVLPALHAGIGWANIKYFGLVDFNTEFTRKSFDGFQASEGNYWTGREVMYTIVGNEAILKNLPTSGLKYLCLIGILSDPTTPCEIESTDIYSVPDGYKLELLVKKDILSTYGIIPDETQDARASESEPQEVKQVQRQQQ